MNNVDDKNNLDCKNLEDVLNRFETQHNDLLTRIIDYKNLCLTLEEIDYLYTFLILLKARTKNARYVATLSAEKMHESICQMTLDKNNLHSHRAEIKANPLGTHVEFMQAVVGSIDESSHFVNDLSAVLVVNDTEKNFITSDNPVIFYNYIAPRHSKYKITTTLACSGFIMLCPITEKLLILLYDKDLYRAHRHTKTTIRIKDKSDIDLMNTLQVFGCYEEIYCYDESEIDYIKNLRSSIEKYIKEPYVAYAKLNKKYQHPDAIGDEIYASQFVEPYYKIKLSFLTFNEESLKIYKKIDKYHNKNYTPHAVFRQELRYYYNL